jgi:hypothetical protein
LGRDAGGSAGGRPIFSRNYLLDGKNLKYLVFGIRMKFG